jgi:hypothetical protein
MDTLEIAVIVGLCLKMALTAVALTMVYKMRFSSSKGTRKLKHEGGQREESAHEEKTERQPVLKSSSGSDIQKRTVPTGKKPLKPEPVANKVLPQAQKTGKAAPSEGTVASSSSKKINPITFSPRNQAGEQIKPTEGRKQAQPENTAPAKSPEPMAASKGGTVKHTAFLGPPQPQAAFTVSKSGEKPTKEPPAGNTSPAGEKNELPGTVEPGTEGNQTSSEPPAATTDSGETDQETSQTQKSGLGDLADLFATSASEFTEKNKLAEQVNDIDVSEILQEGLGLLGKVKKKSDS